METKNLFVCLFVGSSDVGCEMPVIMSKAIRILGPPKKTRGKIKVLGFNS